MYSLEPSTGLTLIIIGILNDTVLGQKYPVSYNADGSILNV